MPVTKSAWISALVLGVMTQQMAGQSARPLSIQASYIRVTLYGDSYNGVKAANGVEGQLRYTKGSFSIGAGLEYTKHGFADDPQGYALRRIGPFLEPRYLIPTASNSVAPYLAARLSYVSVRVLIPKSVTSVSAGSAKGTTLNFGGGLLLRVIPRVNLDLGGSFGRSDFGNVTFDDGNVGGDFGTGLNLILRAGFTLGI